ncbi:MAG: dihydroneopterin aldolase [Actinobacteria bacterium]|nr:MAG: dihydroneopterin aldolase [Actinomycetota bacterium]
MIVEVHGLELFGRHGVGDDERRDGQTFLVDVTLDIAEPKEDEIEATIDYRSVRDIVRRINDSESYQLLETFAAKIADALNTELRVQRVRVSVHKPGIAWAEWTGVTCERP